MPHTVPGIVLSHNGEIKTAKVTIQSEEKGCQLSDVQKYLKKKTIPEILGKYPWKKNFLHLIGYKDGKAGTENKHELPPPLDSQLFFGDIVLLNSKEESNFKKPIPLTTEDYESFYTQMFEGFEDLEEDIDEEEEQQEEDLDQFENEDEGFEEGDEEKDDYDDAPEEDDDEKPEIVNEKIEDEDEEIIPVIRKKVAKSKSKSKSKEIPIFFLGRDEPALEHSTSFKESPTQIQRIQVLTAVQKILRQILTPIQQLELEHHIYNTSLEIAKKKHIHQSWKQPLFCQIYLSTARSIVGNLNPSEYIHNTSLYNRFKNNEITLEEMATFTFNDLFPEMWKELEVRLFEREKRQLEGNKSMATDQFFCKRCKKRECTYYELQTRSADEPMTIFIQCVNCGKQWRQ